MIIPKCDVIIPVWNELEVTRVNFESLAKNTNLPYRLIVIDNGSDEPTREYLENAKKYFSNYKLIRFEKNLGFAKAINSGLKIADAQYICLLNNDTILTPGWLLEMISVMADERIGILNPSGNNWGEWPSNGNIDSFAATLVSRKGTWQETGYCIGFCVLIRKKQFDQIGYLDESYGIGHFEDMDYCRRLQKLGYLCARAKGAYVYHCGGQTFKNFKNERSLFENNRIIFERKWGKVLRIAFVTAGGNKHKEEYGAVISSALKEYHTVMLYTIIQKDKSWIPDHAGLRLYEIQKLFFILIAFLRILFRQLKQKKNKNFDIIFIEHSPLAFLFTWLGFFCKVRIIINPDLKSSQNIWRGISKHVV